VKANINPDMIFWTGDNNPHDIWVNTLHETILSTVNITNMIKEELAGLPISFYPI
jgi:hypothetical protein